MKALQGFQVFRSVCRGRFLAVAPLFLVVSLTSPWSFGETRSVVDIGVFGDFYFVEDSANNGQAYGNVLFESVEDKGKFWVDIGAGGLVGKAGHSYIKATEFYFKSGNKKSPLSLYVGRWKSDWSFADSFWNLGFVQPQFLWDHARPEEQGLTGLFLDYRSEGGFRLSLFGSGVFLPTQGATFSLRDGRLISSNPWFVPPVEALSFSNQQFQLNYNVNTPSASQIVLQPSYGLKVSYGEENQGFSGNAFYFSKPMNELLLPFEGSLNLTTFDGDVDVHPVVASHQLAGMDVGYERSWGDIRLSWIHEGNISFDGRDNTTYPGLPDQNIFSGTIGGLLGLRHRITLGYMEVVRRATEVMGVYGNSNIDIYQYRNRFEKAFRLEWTGQFRYRDEVPTVKSKVSWTQSPTNQMGWLSANANWWISSSLEAVVQCDFFGSPAGAVQDDMLGRFQNNDRCLLGGHYAF